MFCFLFEIVVCFSTKKNPREIHAHYKVYFEFWLPLPMNLFQNTSKCFNTNRSTLSTFNPAINEQNSGNNAALIKPTTHFFNTESDQELYHQNHPYTSLTFVDYNIIIDWNFNIDLLTAKTKFIIVIGCDFDLFDPTAMKIDIYDRTRYNTDQIIICSTFNSIAFVIDVFVEILLLTSFINAFAIIFTGIMVYSDKRSKFDYNYVNHHNIIIINTFLIGGTVIVFGFFLDVIHFVIQVIDESLNVLCSIELYVIIIKITIGSILKCTIIN